MTSHVATWLHRASVPIDHAKLDRIAEVVHDGLSGGAQDDLAITEKMVVLYKNLAMLIAALPNTAAGRDFAEECDIYNAIGPALRLEVKRFRNALARDQRT